MAKSDKATASTWRKRDAAYRKQEKERRDANKARRATRLEVETEESADG
jgi:hypothetical protein